MNEETRTPTFFDALRNFGERTLEVVTPVVQNAAQNVLDRIAGTGNDNAQQPVSTVAQVQAQERGATTSTNQLLGFVSQNPAIAIGGAVLVSTVLALLLRGK